MNDPFADPTPIASDFASADSFRGRLVLIQPTRLELDVPNMQNPSQTSDRVTATVTVVDGQGPVQIFAQRVPTGKFLEGPKHDGVWFSQDRIVKAVLPERYLVPGRMVLARLETYKPGKPAGQGNPWGLIPATDADKQTARNFLANQTVGGAAAPAQQTPPPVQAAEQFNPQAAPAAAAPVLPPNPFAAPAPKDPPF